MVNLDLNTSYNPKGGNSPVSPVSSPQPQPPAQAQDAPGYQPWNPANILPAMGASVNKILLGAPQAIAGVFTGKNFGVKDPATLEAMNKGGQMGDIGATGLSMVGAPEYVLGKGLLAGAEALGAGRGLGGVLLSKLAPEAADAAPELASTLANNAGYGAKLASQLGTMKQALQQGAGSILDKLGTGLGTLDNAATLGGAVRQNIAYNMIPSAINETTSGNHNYWGTLGEGALGVPQGVAGNLIGKIVGGIKNLPTALDTTSSDFTRDWLGSTFGTSAKNLKAGLVNGSMASEETVDGMLNNMATTLDKYGISTKNQARDLLKTAGNIFDQAGQAYDATGGITADQLFDQATSSPVVAKYLQAYKAKGNQNILDMLDNINGVESYSDQRQILNNWFQSATKSADPAMNAMAPVTTDIKQIIDNEAFDRLPPEAQMALGGNTVDDAKQIWGALTPIRKALSTGALKPDKLGIGSDTFAKLAMFAGPNPASAAVALFGNKVTGVAANAANQMIGGVKKAVAPGLQELAQSPAVAAIANSPIVNTLSKQGGLYGQLTGPAMNALSQGLGTNTNYQLPASGDNSQLAASGDNSKLADSGYGSKLAAGGPAMNLGGSAVPSLNAGYNPKATGVNANPNARLEYGLQQEYYKAMGGMGGAPTMANPLYAQWHAGMMQGLANDPNGARERIKLSYFNDPDNQALALKQFDLNEGLGENLAGAMPTMGGGLGAIPTPIPGLAQGISGITNQGATINRNALYNTIKEQAGKEAADSVDRILSRASPGSDPTALQNEIMDIIYSYNPRMRNVNLKAQGAK